MGTPRPDSTLPPEMVLKEAVAELSGQSATARLLGVSQQAISAKLLSGKPASAGWVVMLAAATRFSPHQFRPDLYAPESATPTRRAGEFGDMEPAR